MISPPIGLVISLSNLGVSGFGKPVILIFIAGLQLPGSLVMGQPGSSFFNGAADFLAVFLRCLCEPGKSWLAGGNEIHNYVIWFVNNSAKDKCLFKIVFGSRNRKDEWEVFCARSHTLKSVV